MSYDRKAACISVANKIISEYIKLGFKIETKTKQDLRIDYGILREAEQHFKDSFNKTVLLGACKLKIEDYAKLKEWSL